MRHHARWLDTMTVLRCGRPEDATQIPTVSLSSLPARQSITLHCERGPAFLHEAALIAERPESETCANCLAKCKRSQTVSEASTVLNHVQIVLISSFGAFQSSQNLGLEENILHKAKDAFNSRLPCANGRTLCFQLSFASIACCWALLMLNGWT